jgi:hypothetical protein
MALENAPDLTRANRAQAGAARGRMVGEMAVREADTAEVKIA